MSQDTTILAIEAAIGGGSISLIAGGCEVANWLGDAQVAKAENLLPNIADLLRENGASLRDLDLIAVSAGPGSFTGIRIGIATALGLKTGLGCPMASESVLKAMAYVEKNAESVIAAVPAGRNMVCLQEIERSALHISDESGPRAMADIEFVQYVESTTATSTATFLLHEALFEAVEPSPKVLNMGRDMAYFLGTACSVRPEYVAEPLFISKA